VERLGPIHSDDTDGAALIDKQDWIEWVGAQRESPGSRRGRPWTLGRCHAHLLLAPIVLAAEPMAKRCGVQGVWGATRYEVWGATGCGLPRGAGSNTCGVQEVQVSVISLAGAFVRSTAVWTPRRRSSGCRVPTPRHPLLWNLFTATHRTTYAPRWPAGDRDCSAADDG